MKDTAILTEFTIHSSMFSAKRPQISCYKTERSKVFLTEFSNIKVVSH